VLTVKVDVSNEESVKAGIERVMNAAKKLDILVNCAGIPGPTNTKITEYATRDFDHVVRVNLHGSFLVASTRCRRCSRPGTDGFCCLPRSRQGRESGHGRVLGQQGGRDRHRQGPGKEYAESGVTVNGIAPAVIRTPLLDGGQAEQLAYMTDRIPMKRVGTVEEVAALAAWIVSKEATFNTGFTFDMFGRPRGLLTRGPMSCARAQDGRPGRLLTRAGGPARQCRVGGRAVAWTRDSVVNPGGTFVGLSVVVSVSR